MSRSVIAQLRDIVPLRPLTRHEALVIAERQATRLRVLLEWESPALPEFLLAELPRIEVVRKSPWPASGATQWVNGRWLIVLNGAEPATRQRFSLAHELKHIIDHVDVDLIYAGIDKAERGDWIESVCDYFAGCLLMPRPLLKRAWITLPQDLRTLAATFNVSQAAMNTRLNQTGLAEPQARCARPSDAVIRDAFEGLRSGKRYHRPSRPLLIT